ncbi:MAG: SLC13 family permease [Ardenticatenaceae bacterium]|nr:SLC13 family permease [Ardenticatenaceae bacterium]
MTLDAWLVLGILAVGIVLFITELLRVDIVALGVVVALMLTGVLTPAEAISGFSNTAVITIVALFVVGGAVLQTGLAGMIGRRILAIAGTDEKKLTIVLILAVALLSSIMSDTGTVAVLLPAIVILARSAKLSASKLLIPLAYGSLLGGAMTLIGTPPNIIVSELLQETGYQPFTFFSYTPMGLVLVAMGVVYMLTVGRKLLPARQKPLAEPALESTAELVERYRLPDNVFRLRVRLWSRLIGKTLAAAHLGDQYHLTVLEILRREEPRPALRIVRPRHGQNGHVPQIKRRVVVPEAETILENDDVLIVQGEASNVGHAAAVWSLGVQAATAVEELDPHISDEVGVAEVLLPPRSALLGRTLVETRFSQAYGLKVLGINTAVGQGELNVRDRKLQFGDTLLVQGRWQDIVALRERRRDFVVMGQPEAMICAPKRSKALLAGGVLLVMLVLMIGEVLPLVTVALAAGLLMILSGCLTMDEAYQAIDWKSVVLIAGMIPMSIALEKVGLISLAAAGLVDVFGPSGPLAIMAGLFLLTSVFTQFISNTATAVVVAPVALAAAETLGVQPHAFLMAVAIAASMAFATPVASPSNTLVMGAGSYRFGDYIKVGVPLIALALLAVLVVLPVLYPF